MERTHTLICPTDYWNKWHFSRKAVLQSNCEKERVNDKSLVEFIEEFLEKFVEFSVAIPGRGFERDHGRNL